MPIEPAARTTPRARTAFFTNDFGSRREPIFREAFRFQSPECMRLGFFIDGANCSGNQEISPGYAHYQSFQHLVALRRFESLLFHLPGVLSRHSYVECPGPLSCLGY